MISIGFIFQILGSLANFIIYCFNDDVYTWKLQSVLNRLGKSLFLDIINPLPEYPEGYNWTLEQQIRNRGYQFERHEIQTEDDYILTAFRIPGKLGEENKQRNKYPIFMQHGLIDMSGTWFFNKKEKSLAFQLSDQGYDVWMTNSRGTVPSNKHMKYTIKDHQFWDFTVHEMALYDVPANLKYILDKTKATQVIYIGHSQGTTQWFLANILDKDLTQYFKVFVGVAPVMSVNHMTSFLSQTLDAMNAAAIASEVSDSILYAPNIASFGSTLTHYLPRTLPMMSRNDVGGTSTKNLLFWNQMIHEKRLGYFNYGEKENMKRYNQTQPPDYDVQEIQ
ncbi:lipase member k [Stylonychia lemnae]|uniref:Lipase member k n=1 Tax=Stylonychia lemnae TaxID=5949 RepID=A0A077ZZB9_STYLE|nr:lipase member k [Stylonychia lemnae]|eukprot:CDW75296.1 lipase member k [Stylonychia lemnae]